MVVVKSPMSEPTEDEASAPLLPPPPPPPPPPPLPTMTSSAADEPRVLCVIRDMTNLEIQTKFTMNLPYSTTIRSFLKDIATRLGYISGTFLVSYERPTLGAGGKTELEEITVNEYSDQQLRDICLHCGDRRRNNFNVMEKDDLPPTRAEPKIDESLDVSTLTLGATASPIGESGSYSSSRPAETYGPSLPSDYTYSYGSTLIKSDTGYVGLVNQAMTCYLNSLLQTLYMTPEFRNAIYRWEFDGTEEEGARSIPYQLQRLFLQLQTSKRRAIETTDITRSFGWDSSESWQQHDVQELCRVMFDALEKKWRKTVQADLITRLYQGGLKDYVKCLECGYESARMDTYLDIPLVIRPFGANTAYSSVEEALKAFVQPETLDGNNQYFCERCDKKCNAHKGLKFTSFPYFLTMQLKRFDFDYTTMNRIKLNDKMTFPEILNLNRMLDDDDNSDNPPADPLPPKIIGDKGQETLANDQLSDEGDEGIDVGYSTSGASVASVSDSSLNSTEAAVNDKNAQDSLKRGPYEYELFSIMIHSGSAAGGHYYAYIKSFKDGQWYSFNDQHVTTITYDDIRKTYGGSNTSRGYYSSAFTSSTNGYMLMYRQIDKERNKDFMQVEDFPEHLNRRLQNLQGQEEAERRQRELDRCTCKIKMFCFHPVHQKQVEGKLEVHKDSSLTEATEIAWKQLELDAVVPLSGVRLVRYNELQDWVERSYEGEDDTPMGTLLGGVKSLYTFDLLMEVKRPDQKFLEYKPGGAMRGWYFVHSDFHEGDSIKLTNFAIRFHRLVVHRNTREQYNIPVVVPDNVIANANMIHGTKAIAYQTLATIKAASNYIKTSILDARIKQVGEKRTPEVNGEPKPVIEVTLTDGTTNLFVSFWRKPSDLSFEVNQTITIHDIGGKRNRYHQEVTLNANFLDEVQLGDVLPEVVIGQVVGLDQYTTTMLMVSIVTGDSDRNVCIGTADFQQAFNMQEMSLSEMRGSLPRNIRVVLSVENDVVGVYEE